MSVSDITPTITTTPALAVPARARALAARLAALFEADQEIVARLNDAHRRLEAANEPSWPVADRVAAGEQVRHAFCAYQAAAEQRRQLAIDVGEVSQQLTDTLIAAGHTREQARTANVHQLAAGTWRVLDNEPGGKR